MFYPTDYVWKKKSHSENIIIFLLNSTYSLSTGPTVLISYITVMFYKTTSFETLFLFLLLKIRLSPVHLQCKLHGENFYITLVNVVHSYNKTIFRLYLGYFGKNSRGAFYPTLPYYAVSTIDQRFGKWMNQLQAPSSGETREFIRHDPHSALWVFSSSGVSNSVPGGPEPCRV